MLENAFRCNLLSKSFKRNILIVTGIKEKNVIIILPTLKNSTQIQKVVVK